MHRPRDLWIKDPAIKGKPVNLVRIRTPEEPVRHVDQDGSTMKPVQTHSNFASDLQVHHE